MGLSIKALIAVGAFFVLMNASYAGVWPVSKSWTAQDEDRFSDFVAREFTADIFSNPQSAFYGIATDCADSVYIARIIFAAREGLPVRFTDITKSGSYFTQEMGRWDSLPAPKRLRSFIHFVSDIVSTISLEKDTYPVEISQRWLRPGVIFLSPILTASERSATGFHGGHSEYVNAIDDTGFLQFIASTSPRLVRTLSLSKNPYMAPVVSRGGLRLWKQPAHFSQAPSQLPGYGLNQFTLADWAPLKLTSRRQIFQWHEEIRRLLRIRIPSFEERVDIVVDNVCSLLRMRSDIVYKGWKEVLRQGGRCLSATKTDEYSTDARDKRIWGAYLQLHDLYAWLKKNSDGSIEGSISDARAQLEACSIEYWPGRFMTAWDVFPIAREGRLQSSAQYAPAVRWGFRAPNGKDCK